MKKKTRLFPEHASNFRNIWQRGKCSCSIRILKKIHILANGGIKCLKNITFSHSLMWLSIYGMWIRIRFFPCFVRSYKEEYNGEQQETQYITTIKLYNLVLNNLITLEQNQTVFCLNLNNYKKNKLCSEEEYLSNFKGNYWFGC